MRLRKIYLCLFQFSTTSINLLKKKKNVESVFFNTCLLQDRRTRRQISPLRGERAADRQDGSNQKRPAGHCRLRPAVPSVSARFAHVRDRPHADGPVGRHL